MKVSIIIPAYNEEKRIGKTLKAYSEFFRKKQKENKIKSFEIIVVLNACRDNTLGVVKNYQKKYKEIKYLNFKEAGKGFAVIEGFKDALKRKNDLIGFVDADMATKPEVYYDLIENIRNSDGIIAARWRKDSIIKEKKSIIRKVYSWGFNFLVRSLLFLPYSDTQCLPNFSEVLVTIDGKAVKSNIEKIKDYMKLKLVKKGKNFELYNIENNIKIPALNKKTKKIELVPITGFVIRKDKKKLIRIELDGGRTFFVSENHPLLIFNKNRFYKKSAKHLKKGELLPVVKKWNLNLKRKYLDLIEHLKEKKSDGVEDLKIHGWRKVLNIKPSEISRKLNIPFNKAYLWHLCDRMPIKYYIALEENKNNRNKLSLCFGGGKHRIPSIIKIDNRLLRFLGYYISEGCCTLFDSKARSKHVIRISFNKREIELIKETEKLLKELFGIKAKLEYQENCVIVKAYSRILCYFLKEILECGTEAFNKKVPTFIYGLDKEKIGNFIDTYFLGDGHISLHKQANSIIIRTNSASEKLIKDLQLLLLDWG